jgi:interleukin-1 receptor-associated kinase 1
MVHVKPLEEETIIRRTNPMGTMGYMDPVFFSTGELTTESDVYAFGVVILQLLTGLDGLNIAEKVRGAAKLHSLLDVSAGPWPEVESERLLKLALRCCSLERKQRPLMTCDAEWKPLLVLRGKAAPAKKARKWNCFSF